MGLHLNHWFGLLFILGFLFLWKRFSGLFFLFIGRLLMDLWSKLLMNLRSRLFGNYWNRLFVEWRSRLLVDFGSRFGFDLDFWRLFWDWC
jgi:hypothetical protein